MLYGGASVDARQRPRSAGLPGSQPGSGIRIGVVRALLDTPGGEAGSRDDVPARRLAVMPHGQVPVARITDVVIIPASGVLHPAWRTHPPAGQPPVRLSDELWLSRLPHA